MSKPKPRPQDPRAGRLCTACNGKKTTASSRPHCPTSNRVCNWWICTACGAVNDPTGANNKTLRDGTPRSGGKP